MIKSPSISGSRRRVGRPDKCFFLIPKTCRGGRAFFLRGPSIKIYVIQPYKIARPQKNAFHEIIDISDQLSSAGIVKKLAQGCCSKL
jgi:hypothetical protein